MAVLVGGVAELWQGDLDLGRVAAGRLAAEDLGPGVLVEDLHYGAVAVAQRLEELRPEALILVAATARGRPPGSVHRRVIGPPAITSEEAQAAVGDAVTGYVTVDLVIEVAWALGTLPDRTIAIEVEPVDTSPGEELSELARSGLETALALVRDELVVLRA